MRRHDGCDDATSRAGAARGDIRGDRVVATAARAPQRASVDVVVLHLASAGPAPDLHEEGGALVRDGHTHSHSHGVNEGEKPPANQAHTHSRRTRACALARRTRALALARRALALARGRAAFRDGREGCFPSPGTTPRVGRPAERVYTPSSFARRTRSAAIPAGARRGPRPVSVRGRVHGGHRGRHVRGGGAGPGRAARRRARAARGAFRGALTRGIPVPVPVPILRGYAIDVVHDEKSCIVAPRFVVAEDGGVPQPMRDYAEIKNMLATCVGMREGVRARASTCFAVLAEGEAEVHGMDVEEVHFHEVGAVDSVVDIVAACAAMEYLDCSSVQISPLPMGRGVGANYGARAAAVAAAGGAELPVRVRAGDVRRGRGRRVRDAHGRVHRRRARDRGKVRAVAGGVRAPQNRVRRRGEIVARPAQACCGSCSARFRARRPPGAARATKAKEGTRGRESRLGSPHRRHVRSYALPRVPQVPRSA